MTNNATRLPGRISIPIVRIKDPGPERFVLDVNQNGYQDEFATEYRVDNPRSIGRRVFEPEFTPEQVRELQSQPGFRGQDQLEDLKATVTVERRNGRLCEQANHVVPVNDLTGRLSPFHDSSWGLLTEPDGKIWLVYEELLS
jgi:hypothetical protein